MGKQDRERDDTPSRNRQPGSPDLDELRREIEEIDREIVDNIARRTYIAESIVEAKRERGMEVHDPDREEEVLENVEERAENLDLDPEKVAAVFELLMEMNREEQREHYDG